MVRKIILCSFFFVLISKVNAQQFISLSEAIEIGLENNYQIKITEKQVEIASSNNTLKNTGKYPTVDFNLNSNNTFRHSNNPASFNPKISTYNSGLTPSIDGQWILFNGFKFDINKQQLEVLELQSNAQVKIAVERTIQSIMLSYYQAIIQKEQLKTLEEVLNLSRDRIQYQEIRKSFGQGGKYDMLQTSNAFLNDSTTLLIQKNNYETTLLNLKLAMGIDNLGIRYEPNETLDFNTKQYVYQDLEQELFSKNINLKQLYISQSMSALNTKLSEADRYPTLALRGGVSFTENIYWQSGNNPITQEAYGSDFSNNFNVYANATLSYNLFDAGRRKRNIENAKIEEEIAQFNIDDLKRSLSNELKITLQNYNNQLELLRLTDKLINNASENLKISAERFKSGQISSFDYRAVQVAYMNAVQARLNALFNLKTTEIGLIRLIGGLVR